MQTNNNNKKEGSKPEMERDETKHRHSGANDAEDTRRKESTMTDMIWIEDEEYAPMLQLPKEETVATQNII